jgi:hypothetical protein
MKGDSVCYSGHRQLLLCLFHRRPPPRFCRFSACRHVAGCVSSSGWSWSHVTVSPSPYPSLTADVSLPSLFAVAFEFVSTDAVHRSHRISPQFLSRLVLPLLCVSFELVSARASRLSCPHHAVSLTVEQSVAASTLNAGVHL